MIPNGRCWVSVFVVAALLAVGAAPSAAGAAGVKNEKPRVTIPDTGLTDEQKARHLLNRIAYGPRPGEIERVLEMGLENFIEQQLKPGLISDREVEKRVATMPTLAMSTTDLLISYPPPQLLRGIERQLTATMGMDADAAASFFPELEEARERQRRREQMAGMGGDAGADMEQAMSMDAGSLREKQARAKRGPNRITVELSQAKLVRAIHGERQLQEVLTDFWFNHFNVFVGKGVMRWLIPGYEYEAIRPHVLGDFEDLLRATAEHPAMLYYLDNWLSAADGTKLDAQNMRAFYARSMDREGRQPYGVALGVMKARGIDTTRLEAYISRSLYNSPSNYARNFRRQIAVPDGVGRLQRGLNENYARELLELHTLGVDGGYTQEDIIEVARCFTGWSMTPLRHGQVFVYVDELHDGGKKNVLGKKIKRNGIADGLAVLDLLVEHPSTARFISWKLAQKFVADDPPDSVVERMAATFTKSHGDIREVMRTLLSSEEFWATDNVKAKVKTPLELVVSAARATDARLLPLSGDPGGQPPGLVSALRQMGQTLYAAQPPTGYGEIAENWVSTGDLLSRMKVGLGLAANKIPGVKVDPPGWIIDTKSTEELVERLATQTLGLDLSPGTLDRLVAQVEDPSMLTSAGEPLPQALDSKRVRARLAMGWLLASPDFQRQ